MSLPKKNCTFPKSSRLLTAKAFTPVFDKPIKKLHSPHFLLFVGTGQDTARLGLAITKKKLKNASDRNLIKRYSREAFRQELLPCVDCVLIVKQSPFAKKPKKHTPTKKAATQTPPAPTLDALNKHQEKAQIRAEIQGLFKKLGGLSF